MASERTRSWRAAFCRLRQASSPAAAGLLIPDLLSQINAALPAVGDLSPQEVSADVLFLVQVASSQFLKSNISSSRIICSKLCRMIMDIISRIQLELPPTCIPSVLNFLSTLIECFGNSPIDANVQKDCVATSLGDKVGPEALQVLGQVLYENGGQMSSDSVIIVMNVLLRSVKYQGLKSSGTSAHETSHPWAEEVHTGVMADWDYQRLVFVALGNLFTRAGPSINKDTWLSTIKVLREVLEFWAFSSQLVEDPAASRYYAAILRCVHLALSDPKCTLVEHVAGFVAALQTFFGYGLRSSMLVNLAAKNFRKGRSEVNRSPDPVKALYKPPHLRRRSRDVASCVCSGKSQDSEEAGLGLFSSDSEQSDNDGSLGDGDRFKSSKARTAAILSIQALARADSKALHAHWTLLLPTHDALNPRRYDATLMKSLLFDPVLKTRIAAASTLSVMLEGPSKVFLQVAEYKESGKSGSFITLSTSLGQIVVQLATGLVHLVINEPYGSILMAAFKALSLLVSAAPFGRLPSELLPSIIHAVQLRTNHLFSSATDQTSTMCMAISCLGYALSTVPASPQVASLVATDISGCKGTSSNDDLMSDLLRYAQSFASPLIRVEALQAIKSAVHNYPSVLTLYWDSISNIVWCAIEETARGHPSSGVLDNRFVPGLTKSGPIMQNSKMADEKTVHAAVKLLDESLRAVSSFKGTDDMLDDGLLQSPSPSALPNPVRILSAAGSISAYRSMATDPPGSTHWNQVLQQHLPYSLSHPSPMVRGAALTCFAGLTSDVFNFLPEPRQKFILTTITNAALQDETPSVRSTACRAIGVLVSFSEVAESIYLKSATDVVIPLTLDLSISVRITATWALANICDALRNCADSANQSVIQSVHITTLAECALRLSKDGDKVRANAVRALGNIARFVSFNGETIGFRRSPEQDPSERVHMKAATCPWLERMVQALVSCVTTGNVKVQWNVCHALGNLFLNPTITLSRMTWVGSVYSILLLLLRDSANFKIRIHAASALAVPVVREDYGDSFYDVLQALVMALESLDSGQVVAPSSFRYMLALKEQLTTTSLHVLALVVPRDYNFLRDVLLKRGTFLEDWLKSTYKSAVSASDCEYLGGTKQETVGSYMAVNGGHGADISYSSHDEKLLPPPKERLWYALSGEEGVFCRKESPSNRIASIRKASNAMIEMFRYGGNTSVLPTYEELIAQIV